MHRRALHFNLGAALLAFTAFDIPSLTIQPLPRIARDTRRGLVPNRHKDRSKYSGADIRQLYAERGIRGPRPVEGLIMISTAPIPNPATPLAVGRILAAGRLTHALRCLFNFFNRFVTAAQLTQYSKCRAASTGTNSNERHHHVQNP